MACLRVKHHLLFNTVPVRALSTHSLIQLRYSSLVKIVLFGFQ